MHRVPMPGAEPLKTDNLWALDLDDNGNPVRAHRIVHVEREWGVADAPGTVAETRITACGLRLTASNHPTGWWYVPKGELPLAAVDANHCGIEAINL